MRHSQNGEQHDSASLPSRRFSFIRRFIFFFFKVLFFDVRSPRTHCVCLYAGECTIVFVAHTKKQRSSSAPIILRVPTRPGVPVARVTTRVACP